MLLKSTGPKETSINRLYILLFHLGDISKRNYISYKQNKTTDQSLLVVCVLSSVTTEHGESLCSLRLTASPVLIRHYLKGVKKLLL